MTSPQETEHSRPAWHQGWLKAARPLPSPNFGPRPVSAVDEGVDLIIVHSISLPPGEYGTGCVQALFTNQLNWDAHPYFQSIRGLEVSAHFFIERNGCIWQFVSCDQRAWHAGASSHLGRANCNDYSIGIELEGLEGRTFTVEQYTALSTLCASIAAQYPIKQVAGHEHVAPGRKRDPGPEFDWHLLQEQLGWDTGVFPASHS